MAVQCSGTLFEETGSLLFRLLTTPGRAGQAHEIVAPVLMLSSKGGGYINGAVLTVDGGRLLVSVAVLKIRAEKPVS